MNVLVLHATVNTGTKKDATHAFVPEALAFAAHMRAKGHATLVHGFDNSKPIPTRRRAVEQVIAHGPADGGAWGMVAFFGHGTKRGIQSGHTVASLSQLLAALRPHVDGQVVIALYACSTAGGSAPTAGTAPGGDGGFADRLRDTLSLAGIRGHIDAHTVLGHTTHNPLLRRFYCDGLATGYGGDWIVAPGSPSWLAWRRRLGSQSDTLRFDFPLMTLAAIDAALADW